MFVRLKDTAEVLHDHGKTGVVVPFLLRLHQLQSHAWMDVVETFDCTYTTHRSTPCSSAVMIFFVTISFRTGADVPMPPIPGSGTAPPLETRTGGQSPHPFHGHRQHILLNRYYFFRIFIRMVRHIRKRAGQVVNREFWLKQNLCQLQPLVFLCCIVYVISMGCMMLRRGKVGFVAIVIMRNWLY